MEVNRFNVAIFDIALVEQVMKLTGNQVLKNDTFNLIRLV
jgi:hypothetical protein